MLRQDKAKTRGRKPLSFDDRLVNETVRLKPSEVQAIKEHAERLGMTRMAWKQEALRVAIARESPW